MEIGLVYYQAGFKIEDYQDKNGKDDPDRWQAREMCEMSMALKNPSIDLQIAGCKKYQAAFSDN